MTLIRSFTPWGELLEQSGAGNFTWGYLGGVLDAATGLIYVGNGQYYDPATGRFLSRGVNPGAPNPYVPWQGNPTGMIVGPLALLALIRGKRKAGKIDRLLVLVIVVCAIGLTASGCQSPKPMDPQKSTDTDKPTDPPPTKTTEPTRTKTPTDQPIGTQAPTDSSEPPIDCDLSTPTPTPTPPPIFGLDDPLRYFSAPKGLRQDDGVKSYKSIMAMITGDPTLGLQNAWWFTMGPNGTGDNALTLRELLAILLMNEVGSELYYTSLDEHKVPNHYELPAAIVNATTYKYNQFCLEGPFSAECLNKYWGYYEPIRTVADNAIKRRNILYMNLYDCPPQHTPYKGEALLDYGEHIVNRKELGGQMNSTRSEWVTIKEELNPRTYKLFSESGVNGDPRSYSESVNGRVFGRIFILMSPDEQTLNCGAVGKAPGCNLTAAP